MEISNNKSIAQNRSKEINPCYNESLNSLNCQAESGIENCQKEIANYQSCKIFWNKVYQIRKSHQIKPFMPNEEERKKIRIILKECNNIEQTLNKIELNCRKQVNA